MLVIFSRHATTLHNTPVTTFIDKNISLSIKSRDRDCYQHDDGKKMPISMSGSVFGLHIVKPDVRLARGLFEAAMFGRRFRFQSDQNYNLSLDLLVYEINE